MSKRSVYVQFTITCTDISKGKPVPQNPKIHIFLERFSGEIRLLCHSIEVCVCVYLNSYDNQNDILYSSIFVEILFTFTATGMVVSKSGSPGPVPNSYFLYYIFIKALILIKFEHNA